METVISRAYPLLDSGELAAVALLCGAWVLVCTMAGYWVGRASRQPWGIDDDAIIVTDDDGDPETERGAA